MLLNFILHLRLLLENEHLEPLVLVGLEQGVRFVHLGFFVLLNDLLLLPLLITLYQVIYLFQRCHFPLLPLLRKLVKLLVVQLVGDLIWRPNYYKHRAGQGKKADSALSLSQLSPSHCLEGPLTKPVQPDPWT